MTVKVKKLLNAALKDIEFKNEMVRIDPEDLVYDTGNNIKNISIASIYYGWLIAKYGDNWESFI